MRKLNNGNGFSLTELLVAVLILSMVSAVVAGGIPVARDAYEKVTLSANAQVMLSTAISALRNELGTSSDISINGNTIEYYSPSIQNYSSISLDESEGIKLTFYSKNIVSEKSEKPISRRLVSSKAGDDRLKVVYQSVSNSDKGIVIFKGLKVVDTKNGGKTMAHMKGDEDKAVLKIRVIMQ